MGISEENVFKWNQGASQSMAHTAVIDYLRMMTEQSRSKRRMDAQVDAKMKCLYGDNYQPPKTDEDEEDGMGTTIIYNSVLGDDVAKQLGVERPNQPTPPNQPAPTPPSDAVERRRGWIAASILLGAMMICLSLLVFGPQLLDALYSLEPREPKDPREAIYEVE